MKTMYIPKGQEMRFENVTCGRLIVAGSLIADNTIKAKHISGCGFISANVISAGTVSAGAIDAGTIIADKLIAARVTAAEIHAVQSMAVSSYIKAGYVKSANVTVADAEIDDLEADSVIKLSAKKRGLLGTLLASLVRSAYASVFCRAPEKQGGSESAGTGHTAEKAVLTDDPEFLRLKAMHKLAKEYGYVWQLSSGTHQSKSSNPAA